MDLVVYSLHRTCRSARTIQEYGADTLQARMASSTRKITAVDTTIGVAWALVGLAAAVERKRGAVADALEQHPLPTAVPS